MAHRALPPAQIVERHVRSPWSLPAFATVVTFAFLVVSIVGPGEYSQARALAPAPLDGQSFVLADADGPDTARDTYDVSHRPVASASRASAPAAGVPDPDTAQAIAYGMVMARGWDQSEFDCLVALWNRESHWNVYAYNASSGAYGIPQAVPGNKMASVADDWQTNPETQIIWGLGYIEGRYGTPCGAWGHSQSAGWY